MPKINSLGWIKPGDPMVSNHWRMLLGYVSHDIPKRRRGIGPPAQSSHISGADMETKPLGTGPGLVPVQKFIQRER